MLLIDGADGEGGGQIVRSSLALSLITGQAVRLDNIRARRSKPGLMRQHLTAVMAAAEIGDAELNGAKLGSSRLTFVPRKAPAAGDYEFRIRTAGSTMLVLQTVLLPLLMAKEPSQVVLVGGTHNPLAPPFDFVQRAYAPLVERMGAKIDLKLNRPGFFPAGGGQCVVSITPSSSLGELQLLERGALKSRRVRAVVARLPQPIAERECQRILKTLDWPSECGSTENWGNAASPANLVFVELQFEHVTEVFTAYGERGKRAEQVADEVAAEVATYLKSDAPVGEHLADQLLLPLGLAAHFGTGGGAFRTGPLSDHSLTHIDLLRKFLQIDITTHAAADKTVIVTVGRTSQSQSH